MLEEEKGGGGREDAVDTAVREGEEERGYEEFGVHCEGVLVLRIGWIWGRCVSGKVVGSYICRERRITVRRYVLRIWVDKWIVNGGVPIAGSINLRLKCCDICVVLDAPHPYRLET